MAKIPTLRARAKENHQLNHGGSSLCSTMEGPAKDNHPYNESHILDQTRVKGEDEKWPQLSRLSGLWTFTLIKTHFKFITKTQIMTRQMVWRLIGTGRNEASL